MLRHRKLLLFVTLVGVFVPLSATLGYGLYLRSDTYRRKMQIILSNRIELPVQIGKVRPRDTSSRSFSDIQVTMPSKKTTVFRCKHAVWDAMADGDTPEYALDLTDGWLLVGMHQWSEEDYQALLRSGLGQDFGAVGLRRVHLNRIDLEWRHPDITLTVDNTVGEMLFEDDGTGRAALRADNLNGRKLDKPISIVAHFTPGRGLRFHDATLDVPAVPFANLGLDNLLRGKVRHGTFEGRVRYRELDDGQSIELTGSVRDAQLKELTETVVGGPFGGSVNVTIDRATFHNSDLEELRFRGRIEDLSLSDLVPALRGTPLQSKVRLRVHQADVKGTFIEYFSASGSADEISLERLSAMLNRGTITGRLQVDIRSLVIVDDALQRAEIVLNAVPPEGEPGTIDRQLLQWVADELIDMDLSFVLPEKLEYARLGARVTIEGERLHIGGTHGRDNRTILTARIFGRDIPILRELDRTFEVGPIIAQARQYLKQYEMEEVRRWWEILHTMPPPP